MKWILRRKLPLKVQNIFSINLTKFGQLDVKAGKMFFRFKLGVEHHFFKLQGKECNYPFTILDLKVQTVAIPKTGWCLIYIYNWNLWNSHNFSRHHYFLFLFILDFISYIFIISLQRVIILGINALFILTFRGRFYFGPYISNLPILVPNPINACYFSPFRQPTDGNGWHG